MTEEDQTPRLIPRAPTMGARSLLPRNGTRAALMQLTTSILAATLLSFGAAYVSIRVMSAELDRAKADLADLSYTTRQHAIDLAQLKAIASASIAAEAERWEEIKRRLSAIEDRQLEILRAMPSLRRDSQRDR
jgi:hypothetical protein